MTSLEIAGALERCETLPSQLPIRTVSRTPVLATGPLAYARENLAAAEAHGADPALKRALRCMVARGLWHIEIEPRLRRLFASRG